MAFSIYSIVFEFSLFFHKALPSKAHRGSNSFRTAAPINGTDAGLDKYSPITVKASTDGNKPSNEPLM